MAVEVNIHEAKTQLSRLLKRAASGEEVVIAKAGKPIAKLVPYGPPARPRVPGRHAGQIWVADDFDDYTDELADLFEGNGHADPA